MGKVKYMIARIAKMDYGNMFKTIDKVASINHKNKVGIFFDVVSCGLKYGAGYIDYYQFQSLIRECKPLCNIISTHRSISVCYFLPTMKSQVNFFCIWLGVCF